MWCSLSSVNGVLAVDPLGPAARLEPLDLNPASWAAFQEPVSQGDGVDVGVAAASTYIGCAVAQQLLSVN